MALMYDMNTVNAAMMKAVEASRENLPEGEKLKKVLNCFAGMKPVEAEPVCDIKVELIRKDVVLKTLESLGVQQTSPSKVRTVARCVCAVKDIRPVDARRVVWREEGNA